MLALPIFPGSHPPSIVGANELNFCVRDGNRWTLAAINTNYSVRGGGVSLELLYDSTDILICKELFFKKSNFFAGAEAPANFQENQPVMSISSSDRSSSKSDATSKKREVSLVTR